MQPQPVKPAGLPLPDATSARHGERVAAHIRASIEAAGGCIGFGEYMQQALYAPGLGYYVSGAVKFGGDGDFVTAPEVSPLFGRVIAVQCAPVLAAIPGARLVELGAGSGALAVALLARLAELDALPERYLILEISPDLIDRQRRRFAAEIPELVGRVEWIDRFPDGVDGIVIANEVADALPVERFERSADGVLQICVAAEGAGFVYATRRASERLCEEVYGIEAALGTRLPAGYRSEVSPGLGAWMGDMLDALGTGLVLVFDYGLPRCDYYAADRDAGWIRCHFRHRAHDEPLIYPGIQDITAWVDFSAIAEAAHAHGAAIAGFVTQAMFLLNGGLDNEFAGFDSRPIAEQLDLSRQVKLLTMPGEMGENFKCLGLSKGDPPIPPTFASGDRTHTL